MQTRRQRLRNLVPINPEIEALARRLNSLRRREINQLNTTNMDPPPLSPPTPPPPPPSVERSLLDYSTPDSNSLTSTIARPQIDARHYEIRSGFFNWVSQDQFSGRENESPTDHLNLFVDKCNTLKIQNITTDQLMIIAFPFSLTGEAKQWLNDNESNSFHDWTYLMNAFLNQYFPPGKTSKYLGRKKGRHCTLLGSISNPSQGNALITVFPIGWL